MMSSHWPPWHIQADNLINHWEDLCRHAMLWEKERKKENATACLSIVCIHHLGPLITLALCLKTF